MDSQRAVEELMQLRALTRMTGQIYTPQIKQLEYWPIIAISHAKSSQVTFETDEDGGDRKVYVDCELNLLAPEPEDLYRRYEILEKNIQWVLGNNWKVIIMLGGKVVFTGCRKGEPRPRRKEPKRGRRTK